MDDVLPYPKGRFIEHNDCKVLQDDGTAYYLALRHAKKLRVIIQLSRAITGWSNQPFIITSAAFSSAKSAPNPFIKRQQPVQSSIGRSTNCTPTFSPSKLAKLLRSPGAFAVVSPAALLLRLPAVPCFRIGKREDRVKLSFFSGSEGAADAPFCISSG